MRPPIPYRPATPRSARHQAAPRAPWPPPIGPAAASAYTSQYSRGGDRRRGEDAARGADGEPGQERRRRPHQHVEGLGRQVDRLGRPAGCCPTTSSMPHTFGCSAMPGHRVRVEVDARCWPGRCRSSPGSATPRPPRGSAAPGPAGAEAPREVVRRDARGATSAPSSAARLVWRIVWSVESSPVPAISEPVAAGWPRGPPPAPRPARPRTSIGNSPVEPSSHVAGEPGGAPAAEVRPEPVGRDGVAPERRRDREEHAGHVPHRVPRFLRGRARPSIRPGPPRATRSGPCRASTTRRSCRRGGRTPPTTARRRARRRSRP